MTKITAYAASMFRASTNYITPRFIGITPPPEAPKKAKRKGRTDAQKVARRERDAQKRKRA